MPRHRLALEAEHYRLPAPPAPQATPGSFALCPMGLVPGCTPEHASGLADLYRYALEQAREAARPSRPHDVLFALWN